MLALIAGCSDPTPNEQSNGAEAHEAPAPEEEPSPNEGSATGEGDTSGEEESADPLTVTIGSDEVEFDPTDVYCKVGGGELRHLIAKTNNQPPLLEVTPGEFAMLKLEKKDAPEKNTSPSGIEYRTDGVVFSEATIGSATLNGLLECTETEGE